MSIVQWNNSLYSVGNDEFDAHHKKLLEFINELHHAMMAGAGKQKLEEILNELMDYTNYHFQAEEAAMIDADYPDLLEHKKQHQELIDQLNNLIADFKNNRLEVTIETSKFLKEWLFKHIQGTDKKYASYIKS